MYPSYSKLFKTHCSRQQVWCVWRFPLSITSHQQATINEYYDYVVFIYVGPLQALAQVYWSVSRTLCGRAMAAAVSRRRVLSQARFRSQANAYEMAKWPCDRFPLPVSFHKFSTFTLLLLQTLNNFRNWQRFLRENLPSKSLLKLNSSDSFGSTQISSHPFFTFTRNAKWTVGWKVGETRSEESLVIPV